MSRVRTLISFDLDRRAGDLQPDQSLAADAADREASLGVGGTIAIGRPEPRGQSLRLRYSRSISNEPSVPDVDAAIQADRSPCSGSRISSGRMVAPGHRAALEIDKATRDRRVVPRQPNGQIARIDVRISLAVLGRRQPSRARNPRPSRRPGPWSTDFHESCRRSPSCATSIRKRPSGVARRADGGRGLATVTKIGQV